MNSKRSPLASQDKKTAALENEKDFPTIADLLREQRNSFYEAHTVHHRRDLDSLG